MTFRARSPDKHSGPRRPHYPPTPPESSERTTPYSGGRSSRNRGRSEHVPSSSLPRGRDVSNISQQVQQLQSSLHEADLAMSENEQMLADYRMVNTRRAMEMDELRGELHRSREMLNSSQCNTPKPHPNSAPLSPRLCSSCGDRCGEDLDNAKLRNELEKERLSRERAELNSSKVISLLDTSLRSHTPVQSSVTNCDEISEQIKELKEDLVESTKKLEGNSQQYEQRLKEIDEKIKESSGSPNGKTDGAFDDLVQQVAQLKEELWQRDASEKRRQMLQQIRSLEIDLSSERQRHSTSARQSRKLHTQVQQLGQELGVAKQEKEQALTCLEATSKHLGKSMNGREDLLQKVEELQQALAGSEKQRMACVVKCGQLSQDCFKQEVGQEALRDKMKEVETKMDALKQDRKAMKAKQLLLSQEVAEKKLSETKFREQCGLLERQLTELVGVVDRREAEFAELARKLEGAERECTEGKMAAVQLKADLKNADEQKSFMEDKLQSLEEEVESLQHESHTFQSELRKREGEGQQWRVELDKMATELGREKKRQEQCQQQRKAAVASVSKLERQLEENKKKQASSYSNAVHAVKKLKMKCEELEGDSIRVRDERDSVLVQHGEMQKLLGECQSQLKNEQCRISQVEQENSDLNAKLSTKGKECDTLLAKVEDLQNRILELESSCSQGQNNYEKCQYELTQSQVDVDNLKQELCLVQQSLEQYQGNEKRLSSEVARTKEMWQREVAELQSELEPCKRDRMKLIAKCKKLLATSQSIKTELESSQVQLDHSDEERRSLEKRLDEIQTTFSRKEQDLLKREQSYKLAQSQETKKLKLKHAQITENLQQIISTLELRLADEQASLQGLRRQQLKVLDDQQKVYADDLSKSLEDTDRVRKKYMKAKKLYQEKSVALESEITGYNGENASLRQKMCESQAVLMQQLEEHESLLREAAKEVDTIVHQMGLRVDVPMFPTVVGDGTDVKKWMADMLAKLKWLQKEVTDLLTEESKLRNKVNVNIDYKANVSRCQTCNSTAATDSP